MAHRLNPKPGANPLEVDEIIRRLRMEFAFVEIDRDAFVQRIDEGLEELRKQTGLRKPDMLRNQIDFYVRMRNEMTEVVITDDPELEEAWLRFGLMPGEPIFIGYNGGPHEDGASHLLERCAGILGYEIELV